MGLGENQPRWDDNPTLKGSNAIEDLLAYFLQMIIIFLLFCGFTFVKVEDCERAYFKMDNVLIDDRRIHVDFSQSVAKVNFQKQGKNRRNYLIWVPLLVLAPLVFEIFAEPSDIRQSKIYQFSLPGVSVLKQTVFLSGCRSFCNIIFNDYFPQVTVKISHNFGDKNDALY